MKQIAIILTLLITACQKDETISGQTGTDGTWLLQRLEGNPVGAEITLEFPEKGRVIGKAPCNHYFADQIAPLPWINIETIGATRRACPQLELESQYFQALTQATSVEVKGDILIMESEGGVVLEYKRLPAS
ncbi:hypothetical protein GCM10008927_23250 [Amylibacter ulvae]|uniref:DUF306 domain-containing protein n=1 Tax=Paramylibacter ulvae TaxID=1651968 RepID=A0ABQ3D8W7_9RHOB|nr:META domain-containing protein [Amylibacter ulvae]GHA56782.1 hypothetical protein GCM10008927_23250 [Amylibacter ulvae]